MSDTQFPILNPTIGAGSQPADSDGSELDYMRMPSEMSTYSAPFVPEPEEVQGLQAGMAVLDNLLSRLQCYGEDSSERLDLAGLDQENRSLVNQVLGEGEVSIVVDRAASSSNQTVIQESVLAGVWRVQSLDQNDVLQSDCIEVGAIPSVVLEQGFSGAESTLSFDDSKLPAGVMNAPPLLTEINDRIPVITEQGGSHAINLSLLPQSEQDLALLSEALGPGRVTILSRGYGNCRISATATKNVWWVQYFNSQDTVILNTLEVTAVPEVACAAVEDVNESATRLEQILEVYR